MRRVAAGLDVGHRLQARRGRDQHRRRRAEPRAHHRHVAGVVDDAFLLLERGLVLLVDHDQAEIGERQEQRRARADHHRRRRRRPPRARSIRRTREDRSECQTAGATPKRRSNRSSHCEDSAISGSSTSAWRSCAQAFGDGLQIDLGLARAGDAVEQGDGEAARRDRLAQRGGGGLPGRATARCRDGSGSGMANGACSGSSAGTSSPPSAMPRITPAPTAGGARQVRRAARLVLRQRVQHAPPRLGQPRIVRQRVGAPPAGRRRARCRGTTRSAIAITSPGGASV